MLIDDALCVLIMCSCVLITCLCVVNDIVFVRLSAWPCLNVHNKTTMSVSIISSETSMPLLDSGCPYLLLHFDKDTPLFSYRNTH